MKTRRNTLLIAFGIVPVVLACALRVVEGSGTIVSETRPVSGFDAVTLAGSGNVVITQGETESLTIEADDNLLSHIRSSVQGGRLTLGSDRDDWAVAYVPSRPIRYVVTMKDLSALDLAGSGSIQATDLNTDRLVVTLSGSGIIVPKGVVNSQELNLTGSGQYQAGELQSRTARIKLSGSGSVVVWAIESLDIGISGSGTVSYYDAPSVTANNSGSGSVVNLGAK